MIAGWMEECAKFYHLVEAFGTHRHASELRVRGGEPLIGACSLDIPGDDPEAASLQFGASETETALA